MKKFIKIHQLIRYRFKRGQRFSVFLVARKVLVSFFSMLLYIGDLAAETDLS